MDQQTELGEVQERFAKLVWANAPIPSGELVKLCERGLFENDNGVVKTRVSREAFYAARSEQFVDSTFNGSLPAFLTAFTARKGLSDEEADEIVRMIEAYRKENRK